MDAFTIPSIIKYLFTEGVDVLSIRGGREAALLVKPTNIALDPNVEMGSDHLMLTQKGKYALNAGQKNAPLVDVVGFLSAELEKIDHAARFDQFYPDQVVALGSVVQREVPLDVHLHHQVVERNRRSIRLSVKGEADYRRWRLEYYLLTPVWMKQRGVLRPTLPKGN